MTRHITFTFLVALLALSAPANAEFAGWITACSKGPIGGADCPAAPVGEHMAKLPVGAFDNFAALGMESYAIEDTLRRFGRAILAKANGGGCEVMDEILVASAVWSGKVRLSPRANTEEKALFDHIERILENAVNYAGEGC